MKFSVLNFFKFASRMPQIAQILVSTFKMFRGEEGDAPGHRPHLPTPPPLEISSFFFFFFFD